MKQKKTHLAVFVVALAALVTFVSLFARAGQGQSQAEEKAAATPAIQPLALVERRTAAVAAEKKDTSLFAEAAARNTVLKYELNWAFGGKQQRGWYLYTPLISRLLETEGEAAGSDFASALSRWQTQAGMRPSGVLDDETLYRMVSTWQGTRLKNKEYATPDKLLQAPPSVFYHPMALLVAGWTESLKSVLNPLVGLDTIRHMGADYFKAFLMYLAVQAVAFVLGFVVGLVTAPFDLPLVGNLPGTFLGGVVTFYTSLVVACVLGLALFKSADRLGIEID